MPFIHVKSLAFEPALKVHAIAGKTSSRQPETSHPVLVDLLSPDFNSPAQIEKMLRTVAVSISKRAKVPITNIFIYHRQVQSGTVFDAGEVVRW